LQAFCSQRAQSPQIELFEFEKSGDWRFVRSLQKPLEVAGQQVLWGQGAMAWGMAREKNREICVYCKSEKAALSQGGFLLERGCDVQRHWIIMHEPSDTSIPRVSKQRFQIRPPFLRP
jgi:glutaredoxin